MLGKYCRVSVTKPIGGIDADSGLNNPLNFGFAQGKHTHLPEHIGAYIVGINHPIRQFDGRIIAVITNISNNQKYLVVSPKSKRLIIHEIEKEFEFLKYSFPFEIKCLYERSCGAVVFHEIDGAPRFLLIKNNRSSHWSFPKGHVEKGETDEQTAIREVKEETGLDIKILDGFKAKSEYSIQKKIEKTVYVFAAESENTKTVIQQEEIEDYRWLDYHHAMKNLRFENDRNILFRAHDFLRKNKYI